MAYAVRTTKEFEREVKKCLKRGLPIDELRAVILLLAENGSLPRRYLPHKLSGDRRGEWECHIKPDWLLIWEQNDTELTLLMLNTGSHSDLFSKKRRK